MLLHVILRSLRILSIHSKSLVTTQNKKIENYLTTLIIVAVHLNPHVLLYQGLLLAVLVEL